MGIIQQAIAAMMAVVLIKTLLYRYNRVYAQDCPMDKTARATMLMAQLSSLSYLVGDLVSNLKYKKLAKEAADKAFAVTNKADVENTKGEERVKAKEYNDEQVKSFDTMIEVFDGQEKALETKLALTTVAELGYIAAEVVELVGIAGTTATATTSTATYCSARNSALASIFASQAAFTPLSGIIPSCAASASIIAEKYSRETAMTLTKSTQQALDSLETKTWFGRQLAFFTKQFKDLINVVTSSFNQVLGLFGKIPTERMVEKAKEDARSAEQVAATQSETAADSLEISSLSTATTACIGGASALVPASAATVTAATGADRKSVV